MSSTNGAGSTGPVAMAGLGSDRVPRSEALTAGRDSFARDRWADAYLRLSEADRESPLDAEDLERLATAAYLLGHDRECAELWGRAHGEFLNRGERERAVRCAFWLAFGLMHRGERARAGGWLARARGVLEPAGHDSVEFGYLMIPAALQRIGGGDLEGALKLFHQAAELGERYAEADLTALATYSRGRVLIRMGEVEAGIALLDEAMIGIEAGDVSPMAVGDVYCAVIEGCIEVLDYRRAQEWTSALSRWCDAHPEMVPYRGQCLIHRSELLLLHGSWPAALVEAERACELLSRPPGEPAAGAAHYQLGEIRRLRGELSAAEAAYGEARRWGREPQPGLALLRLAQGRLGAACATSQRVVDEPRPLGSRASALAAHVEIMLASANLPAARAAADELSTMAAVLDAPLLHALSAHATGAVQLAEGALHPALDALRRACTGWNELKAPYEGARSRLLIGLACRRLGDEDTARLDLDTAAATLRELGAKPALAVLEAAASATPERSAGLTAREVQVLRLVAAGKTNRAIGTQLFISEKTVARHVSNIFTKLGVSSRSAATAYAYEHELLP
jgi:DNA-binding CsgD family transcriptional regulator